MSEWKVMGSCCFTCCSVKDALTFMDVQRMMDPCPGAIRDRVPEFPCMLRLSSKEHRVLALHELKAGVEELSC